MGIQVTVKKGGMASTITSNILSADIPRSTTTGANSGTITVKDVGIDWSVFVDCSVVIDMLPLSSGSQPQRLMTGYVQKVKRSVKEDSISSTLTVVDKTIDLVQCTPVITTTGGLPRRFLTPKRWGIGESLFKIVEDFCRPFGITVVNGGSTNYFFKEVITDPTATVWSQIQKICNDAGVVPYCDSRGRLVIDNFIYPLGYFADNINSEVGAVESQLNMITRSNCLSFEKTADFSKRYSDYYATTSNEVEPGDSAEWGFGEEPTHFTRMVDTNIMRWRPLVLDTTDNQVQEDMRGFVNWVKGISRANSLQFAAEIDEWFQMVNGFVSPFSAGCVVVCNIPEWGFKGRLVITSSNFKLDGETKSCSLDMLPVNAFVPAPTSEKNVYYDWDATDKEISDATAKVNMERGNS